MNDATFGKPRTLVTLTTALDAVPPVTFVTSDGVEAAGAKWKNWNVTLSDDKKSLLLGVTRGTLVLFR